MWVWRRKGNMGGIGKLKCDSNFKYLDCTEFPYLKFIKLNNEGISNPIPVRLTIKSRNHINTCITWPAICKHINGCTSCFIASWGSAQLSVYYFNSWKMKLGSGPGNKTNSAMFACCEPAVSQLWAQSLLGSKEHCEVLIGQDSSTTHPVWARTVLNWIDHRTIE